MENPDKFFVFGDNARLSGYGGQARAMRGEENAIGIVTKLAPVMTDKAFFSDEDFDVFLRINAAPFTFIETILKRGATVYVSKAGIGTGLAQLETRAPTIYRWLVMHGLA